MLGTVFENQSINNMPHNMNIAIFESIRPKLMGIAYRFLQTVSDAEDVVQDVYLKWSHIDSSTLDNPEAWLKKVCTRRCLDIVYSLEKNRISYVGTWLPEPLQSELLVATSAENKPLAESLTTAFLLVLEKLTAKERAAYLLHEIFNTPYDEVSNILRINEPACRKLVSRAKNNLTNQQRSIKINSEHATQLLSSFQQAIIAEDTTQLQTLLANDITIKADGGGKVPAIINDIIGKQAAIQFLAHKLPIFWQGFEWKVSLINGYVGFIIEDKNEAEDKIHAIASFSFSENNNINEIFIMRNPDKIRHFKSVPIH